MVQQQIWQASGSLENLRKRSAVIAQIRAFFSARDVLEVETPLLGHSTATDPHIHSFLVSPPDRLAEKFWYLQTSPEFPMKRLLADGAGSIYQICKVFRAEERGRLHNPEFTLLEWYRLGFDHHQLMTEIDALLHEILQTPRADRMSYGEVFRSYLGLDPYTCSITALQSCAQQHQLDCSSLNDQDKDFWLQLLISHCIEPFLGQERPLFITDFPAQQAALAKISEHNPLAADRFELYFRGLELANGYHELCDASEQRRRFIEDNRQRERMGLSVIPLDENLLAAMKEGMPACAGVALGVDRLIMLACGANSIDEVISFTVERA